MAERTMVIAPLSSSSVNIAPLEAAQSQRTLPEILRQSSQSCGFQP
jgi:hypothetical protein